MLEAIIYNVAVTVSGIYLFHRFQFYEEKEIVFSKNYITFLMTLISILLITYPIEYHNIAFNLSFVPLLFLGRYTDFIYTTLSSVIIVLTDIFIFHHDFSSNWYLLTIAVVVGTVGPFIKSSDFVALQWLNAISIIIIAITSLFTALFNIQELIFITLTSFILSVFSGLVFVDIWRIYKLIQRYQNEDKVDYLTGLGNFREFDRYLNEQSKALTEQNMSLSLLLIDIDDFKIVNDQYGHKAGDAVLKQMSQVLINYMPHGATAYRNGGEEFSLIMKGQSLDDIVKVAESIRNGVEVSTFHLPNKETIHLTVSVGVGHMLEQEEKTHRKIFKEADEMLHQAKNQGANTVMFNPIIR